MVRVHQVSFFSTQQHSHSLRESAFGVLRFLYAAFLFILTLSPSVLAVYTQETSKVG